VTVPDDDTETLAGRRLGEKEMLTGEGMDRSGFVGGGPRLRGAPFDGPDVAELLHAQSHLRPAPACHTQVVRLV
jgi:hypothetical protein